MTTRKSRSSIFCEWQMVGRCDKCGAFETECLSRPEFIKSLRRMGWSIGEKVICSKCKEAKR